MKKMLGVFATIAVLTLSGNAFAGEASGKVESVDVTARTIQLDDGNTYTVAEGVMIESLKPGTEVKVSYEEKEGQKVIKQVK